MEGSIRKALKLLSDNSFVFVLQGNVSSPLLSSACPCFVNHVNDIIFFFNHLVFLLLSFHFEVSFL